MSLLFPAYLLGLLGLALPWILHRFSDHQPPEQLFPSKQFLEPTTPPVSRKRTLRYRALLALRALALLLLCVLFAQPWIKNSSLPSSQQLHHMIVVDQSLSMRAEGRWESAKDQAGALIAEYGSGQAQLVGFDSRVSVVATTGQNELGTDISLRAALDEMEPGYAPADYGLLMQRLDRLAAEMNLPVKVWLVSDMQKSSLPAQLNALYAPNVAELEFVTVEQEELANVHLVAEAETGNGATANVSVSLLASAADSAAFAQPIERTVRVEASGEVLEQRKATLAPGELQVMNFDDLVLPAQADPQFYVSILEPDALSEDNSQRLPVSQRQATSVVLLSEPDASIGSASVFLTTALETSATAVVEPIRGTAQQIPPDTPHVVTGRNLAKAVEADVLQFVDTGSNALVFNKVLTENVSAATLDGTEVGAIDEAHPLALGDISWFGTRFYDVPPLAERDGDRILLQSTDGQSILIERQTNRGRLLILNDPLDGLASNLPLQPAFVSLMQSVVSYFDASTSVPAQVVVGERLALPPNVQLIDDSGNPMLDLAATSQASSVELDIPGLYTVVSARGEQSLRAILSSEEADMTTLPASVSSAWLSRYTDSALAADNPDATDSVPAAPEPLQASADYERRGLWQWLLPLCAVLLFAEGWFANRRLDVRRDGS